jgi:hypothetical protein
MRGTLADFLDDSGEFSIELAKQRGVDHLLKNIITTTREIKATKDKPAQVVRTCRGQLYSPIQAAIALARILGIDRKQYPIRSSFTGYQTLTTDHQPPATDHRPLPTDLWPLPPNHCPLPTDHCPPTTDHCSPATDHCPGLEDLIQQQMKEQGLSRDAVVECLLQVRPEIVKYLQCLPRPESQSDPQGPPDESQRAALTLDFITALAANPRSSPDSDPVAETARQIGVLAKVHSEGVITAEPFQDAIDRITSRLSEPQLQDLLHRLQLSSSVLDTMTHLDSLTDKGISEPVPTEPINPKSADPTWPEAAGSTRPEAGVPTRPAAAGPTNPKAAGPTRPEPAGSTNPEAKAANQTTEVSDVTDINPSAAHPDANPSPGPAETGKTPADLNLQARQRANVPTPFNPGSRPKATHPRVLPGLERYLLPTDYVVPAPGPLPPTARNHSPAGPPSSSQQNPAKSHFFSMFPYRHPDPDLDPDSDSYGDSDLDRDFERDSDHGP